MVLRLWGGVYGNFDWEFVCGTGIEGEEVGERRWEVDLVMARRSVCLGREIRGLSRGG